MTKQQTFPGLIALIAGLAACTGSVSPGDSGGPGTGGPGTGGPSTGDPGTGGPSTGGPSTGDPGTMTPADPADPTDPLPPADPIDPGGNTGSTDPFAPVAAAGAVRKVKNLLTGLEATDADVAEVAANGAAGLQTLIGTWMSDPAYNQLFRDKMIFFFRNAFQQTGFTATEDFKPQLLENGGFDFGPFGEGAVGDDVYFRMVQNLEDSFALTAWQIVAEGLPFSDVLTTQRFVMTTALKTLYLQIEMPNDQPFARFGQDTSGLLSWRVDFGTGDQAGAVIPLEDALATMTFDDVAPTVTNGFGGGSFGGTCTDVQEYTGYAQLFQRLIGYTPRHPFSGNPDCFEHAAHPYLEVSDTQDWAWVDIQPLASGDAYQQPYDIPSLRSATTLKLALPRVGFYSTPAFLALWNTNDSNQHRVTVNQALLVALGESFTSDAQIAPVSTQGLAADHAVDGTECYGCHKSLDPMREFWGTMLDYNDRNDFPSRGNFMGGTSNPRPAATGGVFAFRNVNVDMSAGGRLQDVGALMLQVMDETDPAAAVTRFALGMTQKLCSYANSSPCLEADPEFRRVALAFQSSNYSFPSLIRELFSSPLVTGAAATTTFPEGVTVSIARRDQMCQSLSNRLGKPDICAIGAARPDTTQSNRLNIANNIPADAFGRGSENAVTPAEPNLFFRAASEMLCEDISVQVVDADTDTVYTSSDVAGGVEDMVTRIIGYPLSDAHHAQAVQILTDHYNAAVDSGQNATNSFRSTFAAACQSPVAISFGL